MSTETQQSELVLVNSHRLKPVAFTATGFACPPYGGYFHPPVETGGIKIGIVNQMSKKELAKVVTKLIRKNTEVHMAIINLACSSPYIETQM